MILFFFFLQFWCKNKNFLLVFDPDAWFEGSPCDWLRHISKRAVEQVSPHKVAGL